MKKTPAAAPRGRSVGIWIRVSTEDQAQGESPEHHERRARLYAEAKGWTVAEVYNLEAVSGKSVIEHPEAKRMMADIREGHVTALIFSKLARLARSTRELLDFADYFRDHEADLVSLGESIDTSSPAGRLFYTMIAALAQWEREEIASRVAASVPVRAKLGKRMGGQSPYGYVWKDGKFVVQASEAPVRKLMFELFAEHKRKKTVARMLNERGFRTRQGAKWSANTVHRLLRDPSASGTRIANYSKSLGKGKAAGRKPKEDWVYHPVEAIITETLWTECQAILAAQERRPKPVARRAVHPFAGVTYCRCGDKMYVPSNTPKYVCRSCRNKVPITDLDGIFHEQLRNFLVSPSEIAAHLAAGSELVKAKEELLSVLTQEQRKVSNDLDKLFELYQEGHLSKQDFGPRHKPLNDRLKEIERELPALEAELDVMRINQISEVELISGGQDLFDRWPNLAAEDRRDLVESMVEKIIVAEGDIDISLLYTPPSLDGGNKGTHSHGFMAATSWNRAG